MRIKKAGIEVVQYNDKDDPNNESVICDFSIYRWLNPEMFDKNGDIKTTKLEKLKIILKEK